MALPEAPNSRSEQYLAKIAGQETELPEAPNSRVEQYLEYIAENGTVSEEEIAEKVSTWLEDNIHEDPTVVIDASLSVSGAAADAKAAGDKINEVIDTVSNLHVYDNLAQIKDSLEEVDTIDPTSVVADTLFRWTNKSNYSSVGGVYSIYDIPDTVSKIYVTGRNFDAKYYSLYAFEDNNGNIIDHYDGTNYTNHTDLEVNVPVGAVKVYINGQDNATYHIPPMVKVQGVTNVVGRLDTAESDIEDLKNKTTITISCFGDSITDGGFVSGNHTSTYGKSPYPARLYTILKDTGYDVVVNNYGEAGERTPDCTIRVGGYPCILTEDITIPANNTPQSLGTITTNRGRVFDSKLQIPLKGRDNTNFCVHFTQPTIRTTITIDGIDYEVTLSDKTNYIAKKHADNTAITIPAGSLFFTSNNRNSDINIICIGINDQYALRMSDWFDMMKKCMSVSKRCLIVFPWRSMFTCWYDMTGSTDSEKYAEFKDMANATFGGYLLDLYDLWYRYALDYAQASGYLTDLTTAQEEEIRTKLANHVTPAEFTYNNTDAETHLNEAGYQVVAMLIIQRLKALNFI